MHRWHLLDAVLARSACALRVLVAELVSAATATVCLMEWLVFVGAILGSALGGAVVTALFGMWKHKRDREDEHARWLRDKKYEAYSSFAGRVQELYLRLGGAGTNSERAERALEASVLIPVTDLQLHASAKVWESAMLTQDALSNLSGLKVGRTASDRTEADLRGKYLESSAEMVHRMKVDLAQYPD